MTDKKTLDLSPTEDLTIYQTGSVGHIELNRPKALNSLSASMCEGIENALRAWKDDESVEVVVVTSTSPKAFCAGGDVRTVRQLQIDEGEEGYRKGDAFFSDEYRMNELLNDFPKPYVAVMNGFIMGGGLGISLHGSHRVITEKSFGAMPEMAIGFVTDVGVSYATQRVEQRYGDKEGKPSPALALFMGVTGYRFTASDLLWSGIATHLIKDEDQAAFVEEIDANGLDAALEKFSQPIEKAGSSYLASHAGEIEEIFGTGTWFDIEKRLDSGKYSDQFVPVIDNLLATANPTSLVAATMLFRANEQAPDFHTGITNELKVGNILRRQANFAEGIRAVLVDKDRKPSFDPHITAEVDPTPFAQALQ